MDRTTQDEGGGDGGGGGVRRVRSEVQGDSPIMTPSHLAISRFQLGDPTHTNCECTNVMNLYVEISNIWPAAHLHIYSSTFRQVNLNLGYV